MSIAGDLSRGHRAEMTLEIPLFGGDDAFVALRANARSSRAAMTGSCCQPAGAVLASPAGLPFNDVVTRIRRA
ncbi:MAG: hypothetical protein H0X68_06295 [Chloroflexi bacterium]|nr:hypothetical protein [Chloroflexota bacterium]